MAADAAAVAMATGATQGELVMASMAVAWVAEAREARMAVAMAAMMAVTRVAMETVAR